MATPLHQINYHLNLVLANKRLFVAIALAVLTLGVVLAYTLPKKYEAQSTVILEQNVITDLVKGIAVTPSVDAKIKMLSVSLLSRSMLMKVLSELDKDLVLQNESQTEEYLKDISKRIKIDYKEKENAFKISLRDRDPIFAKNFVNTLTRKYIDQNTSSKREDALDATKFLADQIESFKRRIDAADEAINRYKSEKGYMLSTDEIFLRGEIVQSEKKLEDLTIRRNELSAKKKLLMERGPDPGKLADAEARLSDMLSRYTEDNPKVARARAEVASLRSKRAEGSKAGPTGRLRDDLDLLEVEIGALKEMEARQQQIVTENRNLLREIPNVKSTLADLVRKKENEAVIYQQLVSRYGQSEVSKQMELQDKSITFRVLDPAVTPITPVFPNKLLIILGSVAAGLGLGVGVVWLMDLFKGGLKSPQDLRELDIPVLAVVPHVRDQALEARTRRKDRIILGFAAGYVMVVLVIALADELRINDFALRAGSLINRTVQELKQ